MSTTYNKWRYRCTTESKDIYEVRASTESAPTTCRNDTAHTINADSLTVVQQISDTVVKVQEETIATGGNFRFAQIDVQGLTGPQPYVNTYTWKKPISVLDIHIVPSTENYGDRVNLSVLSPNVGLGYGGIGFVAQDVNPGATSIYVTSTVMDNTYVGYDITLLGSTAWHMGEVIEKSGTTNQLVLEYPCGITVLANTVVKQEVFISDVNHNTLGPQQRFPIGEGKIGGSYVPKGSQVNVRYYNENEYSTQNKNLYCLINYLY